MRYIWINPVVGQMYDEESLGLLLERHGYIQAVCRQNWIGHVHNEYRRLTEASRCPVADVRCPAVSLLLKKEYKGSDLLIPEIEPILIHCARELSGREDLKGGEKLIITPCSALADMGNKAALPDTRFLTWKQFLIETGERPEAKKLESSPIPPGFFEDFPYPTASITGEKEIRDYLEQEECRDVRMMEFLWCKDGCHHGDGVIDLE